ncbi:sensor histidine kinase [Polaribacter sp. M15]
MKIPLKISSLFFCLQLFSQSNLDFHKAEEYIINNNLDSAAYYTNKLKESTDKEFLKRFLDKKPLEYSDYFQLISHLSKSTNTDYLSVLNYINREVKDPIKQKKIDVDFFNTKWILITKLRDDAHLEEANSEQVKLENYVNQFTEKDNNYTWATTKLKTHPVVMYYIERNIEKGKKLNLDCIEKAKELGDVKLQIIFLHYLTNYLIHEQKLNEYIEVCEKGLELQKQIPEKSFVYYDIIKSLINAYIYKGGYDKEVFILIDELYNSYAREKSYLLYAQLVSSLDKDSPVLQVIFKKFGVKNALELTRKFEKLGKNLNSNGLFELINMCSRALQGQEYYNEALAYKHKAIELTRKIYSEELSASLASFKITEAQKAKEKEIKSEKELTKLYLIIALLCFFLLIFTFATLKRLRKQSSILIQKNNLVEKSLREKELLIKEMHHRVKNNFQLITSLLDLQTEEIQDQNVIKLLEKGKSRIKSMSLIHQKLYSNQSGLVKFDDFINSLVKELTFLYKHEDDLSLDIHVNEIYFDLDTAIPLALILNELVTNAFKYAFKEQEKNKLYISLLKNPSKNYELIFKDNGPGLPTAFNIANSQSSGLKLVERLVKQLQGNLQITNHLGAKFKILFKDTKMRKEII